MSVERQDKFLTCKDCGEDFIFTVREQDFYFQKGFEHDPARCGPCRNNRKRDRNMTGNPGFATPMNVNNSRPSYGAGAANYANRGNYNAGGNGGGNYANRGNYNAGSNGGGNYANRGNYNTGGNGGGNYPNRGGYNNSNPYNNNNGGNFGSRPNSYNNNNGGNMNTNSGSFYGGQGMEQERKMYPITCMNCGIQTEVPFAPRQGVPVFCRSCYNSQKGR